MTSSPLRSKSNYHTRSISLPTRFNPVNPSIDEHLKLRSLENMYDRLDDLLLLPHTQQAFARQRNEKWVDMALDKHLGLLDVCATTIDVSSQTKQDLQGLLSLLRRRREADDFSGYLSSTKKAKKVIQKSLKDLNNIKTNHAIIAFSKSQELLDSINEVQVATIGLFESLLFYFLGTKADSRLNAFSLASKLMHRKSVGSDDVKTKSNAFDKLDEALHSLNNHKMSKYSDTVHLENVQDQMEKMELGIQGIEEGLQCLFRRLIKTRVILLNILNH